MPDLAKIDALFNTLGQRNFTSIVFKVGSTYYARKFDGTLISSGTTCETVIQAALNVKGTVYITDSSETAFGTGYIMSGSFAGLTVPTYTNLVISPRAQLVVPQGYTGTVLLMQNTLETSSICGGTINEDGTPSRLWTGIKLKADGSGSIIFSQIRDITFYDAGVAIELECSNSRWINSNIFNNIIIFNCLIGILFDQQSGEISQNVFTSVNNQWGTGSTAVAFKDVNGTGNMFRGCTAWDFPSTATECNIKSTADSTLIIGGEITGNSGAFIDQGSKTIVIDKSRKDIFRPDVAKWGSWSGSGQTNADGLLNGRLSESIVGTGSSSNALDDTGAYRTYDTGSTINSIAGLRGSVTALMRRSLNPYFKTALYLNNNTNVRVYAGFISTSAVPSSAADPLANLSGVGLWFDSAVSANWKRGHNDGDATGDYDDTGLAAATATLYPVEIYVIKGSGFEFVFNGTSTLITTEIPATTTNMGFYMYMENTIGAARSMRCYYIIIRNDK